jgi:hypothetical protein
MSWGQRLDFAAWCAWVLAMAFMALGALAFFGEDFIDFYAAGRVTLTGGNVYDVRQLAAAAQAVGDSIHYNPFYYPPWLAVLVAPVALLPYGMARVIWMGLNVGAWVAGLWLLSEAAGFPARAAGNQRQRWLVYLAATYLLAWMTWRFEQLGVLLFASMAIALWAFRTGRYGWGGGALALMATKPTIAVVPVAAMLVWLARKRQWRALAGFAGAAGGLLLIGLPFLDEYVAALRRPDFGQGLAYVLDANGVPLATRINTTMGDWLTALGVGEAAATLIWVTSGVAVLALLAAVTWRAKSPVTVASAAIAAGFWVAPYTLQYDYPLLTVTLFVALRELRQRAKWARIAGGLIVIVLLSVPIWERPISDGFWIVIGLGSLMGLAGLTRPLPPDPVAGVGQATERRAGDA